MGFTYVVQLENIDTSEKFHHKIQSLGFDPVHNQNEEINYMSIVEFIMLYEPQCEKDMLLIMYKEDDNWTFMMPNFTFDLKKHFTSDQTSQKIKIGSKIGSKIFTSNSQIQYSVLNSNRNPEKTKTILQIRFQCQLWVDEPEGFYEKSLMQTYQRSLYSQKNSKNINLTQKMKQIKGKINEIQQYAHQLHEIQADAIGINVFWANPYFATDGIVRKYIKQQQTNKNKEQVEQNKLLKLSTKCIPYVQMIAQQVKQSNKKVKLNIDQFNYHSFSLRNIFNVVYLICHAEVTEVKNQDIQKKFNRSPQQFTTEDLSKIIESSTRDNNQLQQSNNQKDQKNLINIDDFQMIIQSQDKDEIHKKDSVNLKKIESMDFLDDVVQQDGLARIDEEKQSDNMTERKQSQDVFFLKDLQETQEVPNKLLQTNSEDTSLHRTDTSNQNKPLIDQEKQSNYLDKAFDVSSQNNLDSVFHQQTFQYSKSKQQKLKAHLNRRSRSNSKQSISSKGNSKNNRSKSKKSFERNSISKISQKIIKGKYQQFDIQLSNIARSKKHQKKQQKKQRNKQKKKGQQEQKKKQQRKAITYLLGENKWGQLEKITPQDLDKMLKQKMLQKVELFIIHTSYPNAHLPVLKKYSNNVLVINSNPIYPESVTFFFLRYFFKYLFEIKNIKKAHEKALIQTSYMYRGKSGNFFKVKFASLYATYQQSLQKLKFDHVMQNINRKYVYTGSYMCCCYHTHEVQCIFRKNKTTSKYGDAHYKFHVNRCNCQHSNPMIHSCESKKQTLGEYNIIDKKDYKSKVFYNCCCLGIRMGKYKEKRKNKECFELLDGQNQDDPHDITYKFNLIPAQDSESQTDKLETIQLEQKSLQLRLTNKKYIMDFEQGTLQGSYNENFQKSMKYLNENDLLGNTRIITDLLMFFSSGNRNNPKDSQIKNENKTQTININNSMIRQTKVVTKAEQLSNNSSPDQWICNMFGQNSSGRKTISKYLAHLMVVKKIFQKVVIKPFSKVQDLRYLETDQKLSIFYILVYKSSKKHLKINFDKIYLNKNSLPPSLKCIIVTNNKIIFDISINRHIFKTPKRLDGEQMKTYVKLYQHLTPQQKNKLNEFVQLTYLNKKYNNNQQDGNNEREMKIYANQIDSYEIISIIRKSNYQNTKYKNYLQSVSKIHPISLPSYVFITGIIYQTLKSISHLPDSQQKIKNRFIHNINKKLNDFMNNNKAFYIFFDPKRNKRKSKKPKNQKNSQIKEQIEDKKNQLQRIPSMNSKQSQNQQQRYLKEEIIKIKNMQEFHNLLYQNFRKQISLRPLDCLKAYIFYTSIQETPVFSIKDSIFSKGSLTHYSRHFSHDLSHFRTRKVAYQNEFYESTSLNKNSLFSVVLSRQIKEYVDFFNEESSRHENRMPCQQKQKSPEVKKPFVDQNKNLVQLVRLASQTNKAISQHHKEAYNQFFITFAKIFGRQSVNETQRYQSTDHLLHEQKSHKHINQSHSNSSRKKQVYQSPKHMKSQSLPQKQMRTQSIPSKKKIQSGLKTINFQEDEKHLHFIMSAGLLYLRSAITSHVIYSLIEQDEKLQLLKAALILINNALILMKTPHFKQNQKQVAKLHRYRSNEPKSPKYENRNAPQDQNDDHVQYEDGQNIPFYRNQSSTYNPAKELFFPQEAESHHKNQTKRIKSQIQKELNEPFSIKSLLYLLFKIRQRFDSMILQYSNENLINKVQYVKKLSIIAQLFILQLHLIKIAKGQSYQQILSKSQKSQKVQKYLSQIFYEKGRSLNYIKQCLRQIKFQQSQLEVILNQVLSAYIMIVTNYGRIKINRNKCKQIMRLTKYDEEQKPVRKESLCKQETKDGQQQLIDALPKMRILQKITQNKDIYEELKSFFSNLKNQRVQIPSIKYIQKKSHDSGSQQLSSTQLIETNHFENETQVYEKLLECWHQFDSKMLLSKPYRLYQFLQKLRFELTNKQFLHSLRFCSRYINEFYDDLLQKTHKELNSLKEKFIMFFSADPIEFTKPFQGSSSKQHIPEYKQNWQSYKKNVQYQGNQRTIILPTDYEQLNLSQKAQTVPIFQTQKSFSNEGRNSHVHFEQKKQTLHHKVSSSTIMKTQQQQSSSKNSYSYFYIKKKLNQSNIKWLQQSVGCKYLCIDTTVGANNNRKQIIGESEQGELIIFKMQRLAEMINKMPATVIFLCLHNKYLAMEMREKWTKKQIVYFNFQKNIGTYINQNKDRKLSSSFTSLSSFFSPKKESKLDLRISYCRMIARKVTHLIIQRLINDYSQYKHITKLHDALKYVTHSYEFQIKNQMDQPVFRLSNQELRRTVMYFSGFQSKGSCGLIDNIVECEQYHPSKIAKIDLYEQNILSVQEIQEVKSVLKNKYNTNRQSKALIKIQHLNSFHKLYNIFQYYLQDKEHYEMFQHIDLQQWKQLNNKDGQLLELKQKKSGQSNPSIPQTMIREYSRVSNQSTGKRKKDKKSKQIKTYQPVVKYAHKWKSQFIQDLVKRNLLNLILSNKKCFIMFSNSDLINQKNDKHQQWAKTALQNFFKLKNCDNGEHLNRTITEVKIGMVKKGDKKVSNNASLFFIETRNKIEE